jgi:hypothetical protein
MTHVAQVSGSFRSAAVASPFRRLRDDPSTLNPPDVILLAAREILCIGERRYPLCLHGRAIVCL